MKFLSALVAPHYDAFGLILNAKAFGPIVCSQLTCSFDLEFY